MIRTGCVTSRIFAAVVLVTAMCSPVGAQTPPVAFQQWLQDTWPDAQKLGVSRKTFDDATRGLTPDLSLPDLVLPGRPERQPDQAEFVQTPADYLKESSLARLADQGHQLAVAGVDAQRHMQLDVAQFLDVRQTEGDEPVQDAQGDQAQQGQSGEQDQCPAEQACESGHPGPLPRFT